MAPIIPLALLAAAGLYFLSKSKPVTPIPNPSGSGGGGVVPTGGATTYRPLTLDETNALFPDAQPMLDDAPPPHGLTNGDHILILATGSTPDKVIVIPSIVTVQDQDAAIGYATALSQDSKHAGIAFRLDTRQNEDAAYLWDQPASWTWLVSHGFAPQGVSV